MTSRYLAVRVPCGVCLALIVTWRDIGDDRWTARPCGHTLDQIRTEAATMRRIHFGQYVREAA